MACRESRWVDARPLLLRGELQQLGGVWRALHDVLLAWCAEALGGERRPVNKPALFGEASIDRVRVLWPELVAFVERAPSV